MKPNMWKWTMVAGVVFLTVTAYAGNDEAQWDKYSKVSLKPALLTGRIQSDLPPGKLQLLYHKMDLLRFDIFKESDPNTPTLMQWCDNAVKDMQTIREETYEEGDVKMQLQARIERCSEVFRHDLSVQHQCVEKIGRDIITGQTTHYMSCRVWATLTFVKFRGDQSTGTFRFVLDRNFGHGGKVVLRSASVGTQTISNYVSKQKAADLALTEAVKGCGKHFMKAIREVKNFQIHAPIVRVHGWNAYSCLGKDTVELDMPFYVVYLGGTKERRVGFIKAREIHDGCVATPGLKAKWAKGAKKDLGPMRAQVILGKSRISVGKTMWEMPTSYLNFGAGIGVTSLGKGLGIVQKGALNIHPAGSIVLGQDIARKVGSPEVYITEAIRFTYVDKKDAKTFNNNFKNSYWTSGISLDSWFAIQADIGVLKRWFAGPFFFGLGGNLALSYYLGIGATVGGQDKTPMVIGIGAGARMDLGFQLAPRALLALRLGYRFEYGIPYLKDGGTNDYDMGVGHGPMGMLNLMYTY